MPALSAVLLIFSFQFILLIFHVGSQATATAYVLPNIGHRTLPKMWKVRSFMERTAQGNDFELILAPCGTDGRARG